MNPIDRFAKYLLKSFLLCSVALFLYPEFRSWTSFSVSLTCFYGRF